MFGNPLDKFEKAEPTWLEIARWAGYAVVMASVVGFLIAALYYYVLR